MIRPTRVRERSRKINKSRVSYAWNVNGTRIALYAGYGTAKEDPMQMQVEKAVLTANDYFKLPEEFRERFELVNGRMVRRRMAGGTHQRQAFKLAVALENFSEVRGEGFVLPEWDCHVTRNPDSVRIPDVLFVPESRVSRNHGPYPEHLDGAPELAFEVKSKGTSERDMMEKVEQYLANGGRVVWVARPSKRTVTVYRPSDVARVLTEDDDLEDRDLLPGFRYPLRRMFN
jgi:Uma2 family endonuclease